MTEMNAETIGEVLKVALTTFVERVYNAVKEFLRKIGDNLRKMVRTTLVADAPQPCYTARYERDTFLACESSYRIRNEASDASDDERAA